MRERGVLVIWNCRHSRERSIIGLDWMYISCSQTFLFSRLPPFFFFDSMLAGATLSLSQCLSSLICVCVCDLRLSSQSVPISWLWWSDRIEFGGSWVQLLLALWEKENQKDSTTAAPAPAVPFHLAPTGLMLPTSTGGTTTSRGLKEKPVEAI